MRMLLKYHAAYISGNKALDDPVEVVRATDEYMKDNNPVRLWLEDNYDITGNANDKIAVNVLCRDFRPKPMTYSIRKFGTTMNSLGFSSYPLDNVRYYIGIKEKVITCASD